MTCIGLKATVSIRREIGRFRSDDLSHVSGRKQVGSEGKL
jgi:hypothetical protein